MEIDKNKLIKSIVENEIQKEVTQNYYRIYVLLNKKKDYKEAFDFFNISGSMFVKQMAPPGMAASAQGVFMLMTNGVGAVLGSSLSGLIIDHWFIRADGSKDWHGIWTTFALRS